MVLQPNSNSDNSYMLDTPQDALAHILKELQIITILLREGFNIPDETASLSQQPQPLLNPTIVVQTIP